jgi:F-type H+-transporting ATPase subunit alpha
MVATLNQPQYQPWPMEEQVVAIFAAIHGYLDGIDAADVPRFQDELREHLRSEESLYAEIRDTKDLPDELADRLRGELDKFADLFGGSSSEG